MTHSQTTAPSLLGLEEDGRDLFGLAAHKLNTPLACIRGFVSTLLQRGDQLDTETVQQFLSLVLTQTDRLQGLVRDFLLLARVNGGIEALARPFRPRDVLLTLVDDLGTEGVRVRFAGDVDSEAVGDAELVKLPIQGVRAGSDEPVERRGSGAGLGLTLAKAYAQVLGGEVGGRADERGTVFWIKVPAPAAEGA